MTPTRTAGDEFAELFGGQIVQFSLSTKADFVMQARVVGSRCTDRWAAFTDVTFFEGASGEEPDADDVYFYLVADIAIVAIVAHPDA